MSQLLETAYIPGRNLYVVIHAGGQVWNKDTVAFENYSDGNWVHYAVPLTPQGSSGYYSATYPVGISAGTLSTDVVYAMGGATPVLPGTPGGDSFLTLMQSQGTNVQKFAGDGQAPINMAAAANVIISSGIVGSGTITSSYFPTNLPSAPAQAYVGRIVAFTSGVNIGQETNITAYNPTGGVITVTALTNAPTASDTFVLL